MKTKIALNFSKILMQIACGVLPIACAAQVQIGNFIGSRISPPEDREAAIQARAQAEYNFIPSDSWRDIGGTKSYAKGTNWAEFAGEIQDVYATGIVVRGTYSTSPPIDYNKFMFTHGYGNDMTFFVSHYSHPCAVGDFIESSTKRTAKIDGFYNVEGSSEVLHKLEYGTPCDPPANLVQARIKANEDAANAARELAQKKKAAADTRAVEWLAPQATNGDASAQYSLGIHYLSGQGCETNREIAVFWLKTAADQGNTEASNKLAQLETSTNKKP